MDALRRLRIAKLTTTLGITNSLLTSSACSIEIWSTQALKRLELHEAQPSATLTPLSSSPNFPRAQYLDIRTLTHELIVNYTLYPLHRIPRYIYILYPMHQLNPVILCIPCTLYPVILCIPCTLFPAPYTQVYSVFRAPYVLVCSVFPALYILLFFPAPYILVYPVLLAPYILVYSVFLAPYTLHPI